MQIFIERWRPFFFCILFIIAFHFWLMPTYSYIIIKNTPNIISTSSTLASVFLGFIGVIIGVIVSVHDSKIIKLLKQAHLYNLLKEYIRVSFYSCILTLSFSIILLFISPENIFDISWWYIEILTYFIFLMIATSLRIIDILFAITGIDKSDNDNNLWTEKTYSPDKV